MDWSKTENIIFVSVVGAAILFFLATTIAVIAKGKRYCKAGDVLLRIASSLVFACSTVLLACVILSLLTGSYRIDVENAPTLYFGAYTVVLPVPQLFEAIASTVGSDLVTGLFVVSLVALICDCLLANKKKAKKSDALVASNGEVDSEGGNATLDAAAATDETSVVPENMPESSVSVETDAPESEDEIASDEVDHSAPDDENQGDEKADETEDKPWYNEDGEFDLDDISESKDDGAIDREREEVESETPDAETTNDVSDYPEDTYTDENVEQDEPEQFETVGSEYESDEPAEQTGQDEQTEQGDEPEQERDEYAESESIAAEQDEDEIARGERELEEFLNEPIEPDRDIYIPEIRTVKRGGGKSAKSTSGSRAKAATKSPAKSQKSKKTSSPAKSNTKKSQKESAATDNKSLPMGRRYVIIDRRSAVNIFSDYLKERDKQDKEKLESSINKIILK